MWKVAELCGNAELTKMMRALLTRSTMNFSLAAPERFHNCAGTHEHGDIVAAILAGKTEKASKLMLAHLAGLLRCSRRDHRRPSSRRGIWRFPGRTAKDAGARWELGSPWAVPS
jgi:DNA-binding GntR family transcriptional regulator